MRLGRKGSSSVRLEFPVDFHLLLDSRDCRGEKIVLNYRCKKGLKLFKCCFF